MGFTFLTILQMMGIASLLILNDRYYHNAIWRV